MSYLYSVQFCFDISHVVDIWQILLWHVMSLKSRLFFFLFLSFSEIPKFPCMGYVGDALLRIDLLGQAVRNAILVWCQCWTMELPVRAAKLSLALGTKL